MQRVIQNVERITSTAYGGFTEYFRVTFDCGHMDDIPVGNRRRCPSVWQCGECAYEERMKDKRKGD